MLVFVLNIFRQIDQTIRLYQAHTQHRQWHIDTDEIWENNIIQSNYKCQCRIGVRHRHISEHWDMPNLKSVCAFYVIWIGLFKFILQTVAYSYNRQFFLLFHHDSCLLVF
jgi:hypothetical protein